MLRTPFLRSSFQGWVRCVRPYSGSLAVSGKLDDQLTPQAVVDELDKYIVGQKEAKRAVAVSLRDRWRRRVLPKEHQREVSLSSILLKGPTGCGKTEIARRLARIADAPFVKTEATRFTEMGIYGQDAENMIMDLANEAFQMETAKAKKRLGDKAKAQAVKRVVSELKKTEMYKEMDADELTRLVNSGTIDTHDIEIEMPAEKPSGSVPAFVMAGDGNLSETINELRDSLMKEFKEFAPPQRSTKKTTATTVGEAVEGITNEVLDEMLEKEPITKNAVEAAEEMGIVFIDEIDKLAKSSEGGSGGGGWRKGEGVQKELLGLLEGTTVRTRIGPIRTDHVLFITAGSFSLAKPSDLLPELQGRLPVRVSLKALTKEDFKHILKSVEYNVLRQQELLLASEGVKLIFSDDAVEEIALTAMRINNEVENIGARRLRTVVCKVMEDLSFSAHLKKGESVTIDAAFVRERVNDLAKAPDSAKFIL